METAQVADTNVGLAKFYVPCSTTASSKSAGEQFLPYSVGA